jgi:hypothetical protein
LAEKLNFQDKSRKKEGVLPEKDDFIFSTPVEKPVTK